MCPLLLFDYRMLPWLLCPLPEETGLWHLDPAPCPLHLPPGDLHHPPGPSELLILLKYFFRGGPWSTPKLPSR